MRGKNSLQGWRSFPGKLAAQIVRVYQTVVSPLKTVVWGPLASCRFYPTCSEYAIIALRRHGLVEGGSMALRRVLRCHPFNPGGYDPVAPVEGEREEVSNR